MPDKEHPRYSKEELRQAFYAVSSLDDEIANGGISEEEVTRAGFIDNEDAKQAIEAIGHLLELYGA